jgi:hypothetical protein
VSKAKLDFPEPESPVMTTNLCRGIATSIFFRLCNFAPLIRMCSFGLSFERSSGIYDVKFGCKDTIIIKNNRTVCGLLDVKN